MGPHHLAPALAAPGTGTCLVQVEPHDETLPPASEQQSSSTAVVYEKVPETIHFHSNF